MASALARSTVYYMTHEEVEFGSAMTLPVADGLDAVDEALALYRSSRGGVREAARRMLCAQRLMFEKIAPLTNCAHRWEMLRSEIVQALP